MFGGVISFNFAILTMNFRWKLFLKRRNIYRAVQRAVSIRVVEAKHNCGDKQNKMSSSSINTPFEVNIKSSYWQEKPRLSLLNKKLLLHCVLHCMQIQSKTWIYAVVSIWMLQLQVSPNYHSKVSPWKQTAPNITAVIGWHHGDASERNRIVTITTTWPGCRSFPY